jgi:hypothetical protein
VYEGQGSCWVCFFVLCVCVTWLFCRRGVANHAAEVLAVAGSCVSLALLQ